MVEKYTGIETFSINNIPLYMEAAKNGCVVAFDTETTGLHNHDDIVEFGYVSMEKGIMTFEYSVYVKNTIPLDGTEAAQVNGLTDAFLAEHGEDPVQAFGDLRKIIGNKIEMYGQIVLVAHNLPFDLRMLSNGFARHGVEPLPADRIIGCDTKEFVKTLNLPKEILPGNHLRNCIDSFALDAKNSHDALDDTRACMELFKFLTRED